MSRSASKLSSEQAIEVAPSSNIEFTSVEGRIIAVVTDMELQEPCRWIWSPDRVGRL